jgi:hypothetical protein
MRYYKSVPRATFSCSDRLQVIVNNLKALGKKINDDDVSHRFLMCLPPIIFETLRLIIIIGGLKQLIPNQVLGDVMT